MSDNKVLSQLLAACCVTGATGVATAARGCATARTGAGVYTVTLDQPVDANESILLPNTTDGTGDFAVQAEHTSDTVKTVRTFTAGAAADHDFSLAVLKFI